MLIDWDLHKSQAVIGFQNGCPQHYIEVLENSLHQFNLKTSTHYTVDFLKICAAQHLLEEAALSPISQSPPPPQAAPEINYAICSKMVATNLKQLIEQKETEIIAQVLDLLYNYNYFISPDLLATLLNLGVSTPILRPKIQLTMGSRGEWLAQFTPQWSTTYASTQLTIEGFSTSPHKERLYTIRELHRDSPEQAIELLQQSWKTLSSSQKIQFIAIIEDSICALDAPFLESCLEEKRSQVRQEAVRLLTLIPSSKAQQRFKLYLKHNFSYDTKKKKFIIKQFERFESSLLKDGFSKKTSHKDCIIKILSMLPNKQIIDALEVNSSSYINNALAQKEYAFIHAWIQSATRFGKQEELYALYKNYLLQLGTETKNSLASINFYRALDKETAERCFIFTLKTIEKPNLDDTSFLLPLLMVPNITWTPPVAATALNLITEYVQLKQRHNNWAILQLIKKAGSATPVHLHEQLIHSLPNYEWGTWREQIYAMLDSIKLRLDIENSLK